ncbi:efflux RND transporter periplasmic adaptor subunit [Ochrovirga pacifica]|uniref:efflux RND transporter periplasmic adaptor subunit n=1 Tax=Ochrovirga pacifica TaxID=1042376 RepID=UPI0002557B65|nr:efflux RND transporter periplasmic adaptor subunit [Ochrovirga pacifica]
MKKSKTIFILLIIVIVFVLALGYLWQRDQKKPVVYQTKKATVETIVQSTVASGKITPKEEVIIRPNIPGIIDEIYVEAGDTIQIGDLIAKIKVIPTVDNIQAAANAVSSAKIDLDAQQKIFDRQQLLFNKGVISANDYDKSKATYQQSKQKWVSATENYQIIKTGTTRGFENLANTLVKATIGGVVLEVPVKNGFQVIPSNNFNEGTKLATIADSNKMIFEGTIDESEVGKIKEGMPIDISIGALPDVKFQSTLDYIAPKGVEENGAVQFDIESALKIPSNTVIRAGLSANASIILDKAEKVLAIKESLLQFDKKTKKPYVEVLIGEQEFKRKDVVLGVSDGITVEIKSGISKEDKIKDWNAIIPNDKKEKKK